MATAPELTVLGSGFLHPIEKEAVLWLAQRRADQDIWLREHNATLAVLRMSDDLFDIEIHAKVTDPAASLKLSHPGRVSFTEDACFEFARDGLIPEVPPKERARETFFQVVTAAMKDQAKAAQPRKS